MKTKQFWAAVGALALAGSGVLLTSGAAQAAPSQEGSRLVGPLSASDASDLSGFRLGQLGRVTASPGTWVTMDQVIRAPESQATWNSDAADPRWAEAAQGADLVSIPALGTMGEVRFVSGAAEGLCLTKAEERPHGSGSYMMRAGACTEADARWVPEPKGIGFILRYDRGAQSPLYFDWDKIFTETGRVPDLFNGSLFVPESAPSDPADVTAQVDDTDVADKSADLSGTGEPGAVIEVRDDAGEVLAETTVDENGDWSVTVPGLEIGDNDLTVVQVIDDEDQSSAEVTVTLRTTLTAQDVTVQIEQGATAEVDVLATAEGDNVVLGEVTVEPGNGTAVIVDGMVVYTPEATFTGEDSFKVTVTDEWGNTEEVTVTVIVAPFEDVPLMSAGVGLAGVALAGLGGVGLRVRKHRR